MKLYLLRPKKRWVPWYDSVMGFVIRATSVKQAREIASKNARDEGQDVWLNNKKTTCAELTTKGKVELVIIDFAAA